MVYKIVIRKEFHLLIEEEKVIDGFNVALKGLKYRFEIALTFLIILNALQDDNLKFEKFKVKFINFTSNTFFKESLLNMCHLYDRSKYNKNYIGLNLFSVLKKYRQILGKATGKTRRGDLIAKCKYFLDRSDACREEMASILEFRNKFIAHSDLDIMRKLFKKEKIITFSQDNLKNAVVNAYETINFISMNYLGEEWVPNIEITDEEIYDHEYIRNIFGENSAYIKKIDLLE